MIGVAMSFRRCRPNSRWLAGLTSTASANMSKRASVVAVGLLCLLTVGLAACGDSEPDTAPEPTPAQDNSLDFDAHASAAGSLSVANSNIYACGDSYACADSYRGTHADP